MWPITHAANDPTHIMAEVVYKMMSGGRRNKARSAPNWQRFWETWAIQILGFGSSQIYVYEALQNFRGYQEDTMSVLCLHVAHRSVLCSKFHKLTKYKMLADQPIKWQTDICIYSKGDQNVGQIEIWDPLGPLIISNHTCWYSRYTGYNSLWILIHSMTELHALLSPRPVDCEYLLP